MNNQFQPASPTGATALQSVKHLPVLSPSELLFSRIQPGIPDFPPLAKIQRRPGRNRSTITRYVLLLGRYKEESFEVSIGQA